MSFVTSNAQPIVATATSGVAQPSSGGFTQVEQLNHWKDAETQALTNWCWAAAARAIQRYYRLSAGDHRAPASQCCYVARQHGDRYPFACMNSMRSAGQDCNSCWSDGKVNAALNFTGRLPELLRTDGHLDESEFTMGIESVDGSQPLADYFRKIREKLRQKRPVALHFEKLKQTTANHMVLEGHFVVAYGFNRHHGTMDIWDPDPDYEEPVLLSYFYKFGALAHLIYTKP